MAAAYAADRETLATFRLVQHTLFKERHNALRIEADAR